MIDRHGRHDRFRDPFEGRRGPKPARNIASYFIHEIGLKRKNQEDSFCLAPEYGIAAVADGMGGHEGGEVASKIAAESVLACFANAFGHRRHYQGGQFDPSSGFEELARRSIRFAHWHIQNLANQEPKLREMGTTLSFLGFYGYDGIIGHVGDSCIIRARRRDTTIKVLTDSMRYDTGVVGLSRRKTLEMQVRRCSVEAGDRFFLCSDGVTDMLDVTGDSMNMAYNAPDLRTALDIIRLAVLDAGARDNFTVVGLDFLP